MPRAIIALILVGALASCAIFRPAPRQDFFVAFFVPGTIELTPEAIQIVQQAAATARSGRLSKIKIGVPTDAPGGIPLVEGRITAIQNILSASGANPMLYMRAPVSAAAAMIEGAANRAEIRLVP